MVFLSEFAGLVSSTTGFGMKNEGRGFAPVHRADGPRPGAKLVLTSCEKERNLEKGPRPGPPGYWTPTGHEDDFYEWQDEKKI